MDYVWWFSSLCVFLGFEMCALKEGRRKEEKWEGGNEEWTPGKRAPFPPRSLSGANPNIRDHQEGGCGVGATDVRHEIRSLLTAPRRGSLRVTGG